MSVPLKVLQRRKKEVQAELQELKAKRNEYADLFRNKLAKFKDIEEQIKNATARTKITEHAVLRYLERKYKLDLKQIEREILTDELKQNIEALGDGEYPLGDGVYARVRDKAIITIINK